LAKISLQALTVALLLLAGCRQARQVSPEAAAWQAVDRDPAETGRDAGRWPCWRGPGSQGIAPAGTPPVHFGPTQSVRWKAAVSGQGHSSPVVWDGRVLLTTALPKTDPPTLAVLCLDRNDGRLLWQTEVGAARGPTHPKNGHASATVATDGTHVLAFFGSTGLFCLDLNGKQLWKADLGTLDHKWGTASSPLLSGDLAVQLCDSETTAFLVAMDKTTGREVWRTARQSTECWSTPVAATVTENGRQRTEILVNGGGEGGQGSVVAYSPDDGRELWRVSGTTELVTPTILLAGGLAFSVSGRNGPIFAVRPGGSGDVSAGRVAWRIRRGGPYIPSGVVYRNRLYLVSDAGVLSCYNAGNGELLWRARLRGVFSASLVAAAGRIYATSEQGTVYVVLAADLFAQLAANPMNERCLATPAVAGDALLVRTAGHVYCLASEP